MGTHLASLHTSSLGQAMPQLPQWEASVVRSKHPLAQAVSGDSHTHAPARQASFASHEVPQLPQWVGSRSSSTQPPLHLAMSPEQLEAQVPKAQT